MIMNDGNVIAAWEYACRVKSPTFVCSPSSSRLPHSCRRRVEPDALPPTSFGSVVHFSRAPNTWTRLHSPPRLPSGI